MVPCAKGKSAPDQAVKAEEQFEADEANDVPFQAQAALVVHEFDEGPGGLADQRQLSLHCTAALDQLVFVLQSRIKPLELGMVPKNIGLFLDLAFVQTLGISSLLFTLIGYSAGRLRELRATRPAAEVERSLDELERAARSSDNVMPRILAASEAYATVGEISDTLRRVFGEHREQS